MCLVPQQTTAATQTASKIQCLDNFESPQTVSEKVQVEVEVEIVIILDDGTKIVIKTTVVITRNQ